MRKRVIPITLAIATTTGAVLAGAPAAQANGDPNADHHRRTTQVRFLNLTGCELRLRSARVNHGAWGEDKAGAPATPPSVLPPYDPQNPHSAEWETGSDGLMTGTAGEVKYLATGCELAGKVIQYSWNNPYMGANEQSLDGTDKAFEAKTFGGSGDHAQIQVEVGVKNQLRTGKKAARASTWLVWDWTYLRF